MQMENDFLRAISRTVHSLIAENHVGIIIQMTTTGKSLIDGEIIQLSNLSYLRLCKSIFMARLDSGFNHIRVRFDSDCELRRCRGFDCKVFREITKFMRLGGVV